jgi:hypothetical protein
MKNIHLIPTDKPSRLLYSGNNKNLLFSKEPISFRTFERSPQNIYITNNEKIKEGDWTFDGENPYKWTSGDNEDCLYNPSSENYKGCKKIILTTDQDLIVDGIQAIDDEFLEWFVENPSCEEVEVKPLLSNNGRAFFGYKIIIPEEEPKQETLKEAAERLFKEFQIENPIVPNNHIRPFKLGFIKSAKWQAERMYSEEDMIEFAEFVATYPDKNKNINGQILHAKSKYDGSERTVDLLEQFKKK